MNARNWSASAISQTSVVGERFAAASDFTDGVYAAALALKIRTHQYLPNQARAKEHQSGKPEQGSSDQKRSMLNNDILTGELIAQHSQQIRTAESDTGKPPFAEEMHRSEEHTSA